MPRRRRRRPSFSRFLLSIVLALVVAALVGVLAYRGLIAGFGTAADNAERRTNCLDWERERGQDAPDC